MSSWRSWDAPLETHRDRRMYGVKLHMWESLIAAPSPPKHTHSHIRLFIQSHERICSSSTRLISSRTHSPDVFPAQMNPEDTWYVTFVFPSVSQLNFNKEKVYSDLQSGQLWQTVRLKMTETGLKIHRCCFNSFLIIWIKNNFAMFNLLFKNQKQMLGYNCTLWFHCELTLFLVTNIDKDL